MFQRIIRSAIKNHDEQLVRDENEEQPCMSRFAWVWQLTAIVLYYLLMCLFFSHVAGEGNWTVLEGIYFTTVTVTTVGYGDLSPSTPGGKMFVCIMILFGLSVIFSVMVSVITNITAATKNRAQRRSREKKIQKKVAERLAAQKAGNGSQGIELQEINIEGLDIPSMVIQAKIDVEKEEEDAEDEPMDQNAVTWHYRRQGFSSVMWIVMCVLIGTIGFWQLETRYHDYSANDGNTPVVDALYFSVVTVTTVGYGDISIERDETKVFLIVYILICVASVAGAIGNLSEMKANMDREKKELEILNKLDFSVLESLDTNGDGVDINEYVLGMLKILKLVNEKKIRKLEKQFRAYDKDGSGMLDREDLKQIAEEEEAKRIKRLKSKGK